MAARLQRAVVPLALLTAIGLIVAWFPFSTLMSQSGQLDATSSQIAQIHRETQALAVQQHALQSRVAITMLAREEYQLVEPGQRLIQIVDSSQSGVWAGDPGDQPLVSPTATAALTPTSPTAPPKSHAGFVARVLRTLEFWR